MKRNGRLPVKSEIQSAARITVVRLSSVSSLMLREAVRRSSFADSRSRRPVAVSRSIAAAGRARRNSSRSPRSTTTASRSFVTCADAVRGPPSSSEISPKKSPLHGGLQHDALAGVVLEEDLDLAGAHDVERVARIAVVEQRRARRLAHRVDAFGQRRPLLLVQQREERNLASGFRDRRPPAPTIAQKSRPGTGWSKVRRCARSQSANVGARGMDAADRYPRARPLSTRSRRATTTCSRRPRIR